MCNSKTTVEDICFAELFDDNEDDGDNHFCVPSPYKSDYSTILSSYVTYQEFNLNVEKYTNPCIFMQLNIFSLPSKWDNFKSHLHFLSEKKKVNFIALSETYLNDKNCCDFDNLPGYHPLSLCEKHRTDRKGGGVAIYIDDKFDFVVREDFSYFSNNIEMIVAEINPQLKDSFFVCSLYRSPGVSSHDLNIFEKFLNDLISKVKQTKVKACYILGDLNVNLLNYGKQSF